MQFDKSICIYLHGNVPTNILRQVNIRKMFFHILLCLYKMVRFSTNIQMYFQYVLIDWYLTPTLTVFQLYCCMNIFFILDNYKILRNKIYLSKIQYVSCCVRLSCLIFAMLFSVEFPGSQISPVTYCTNVQLWRLYFLSVIDFYLLQVYAHTNFSPNPAWNISLPSDQCQISCAGAALAPKR